MIELNSTSKPSQNALVGAEFAVAEDRRVRSGSEGTHENGRSRALEKFVVTGKGAPTERRTSGFGGALESVIGVDDRERIIETDIQPWRMICALRIHGANGGVGIGTGWLAGPRTVVTAGHCVHHSALAGWADTIQVSAGQDRSDRPFGTITASRFSSVDRWVSNADPDFDVGCIHLDESLGDTVGWFSTASLPPSQLEAHRINISGYPSDRGAGTEQYFHANRILHVSDRRVFYDVDTFGGQSGSPVWIHEEDEAPPLVVAIHAYGTGGTPFDLGITANSAPRIIPEVYDLIESWIEADSPG